MLPTYTRVSTDPLPGLQGVAINFVKSDDIRILRDIEQYYSTQVDEMVSCVLGQQWTFVLNHRAPAADIYVLLQPMNVADLI